MKRSLLVASTILFLFFSKARAQSDQIVISGAATTAVNFPGNGSGCIYNWVNDTPGIGLPASGTGSISSFIAVNNNTTPLVANITVTATPAGILYIANPHDGVVSVINTASNTLTTTIKVGSDPQGISINPDGSRVYVTNTISNTVSVINTSTNTVITNIAVGANPIGVWVSLDGNFLYVVNAGSNAVSVINTATNILLSTIMVGTYPEGITGSADGKLLYVANSGSNTVSVINTATDHVDATIAVGIFPTALVVSPDDTKLYVVNADDGSVTTINTLTNSVVATIIIPLISSANSIAISPDGNLVYVLNGGSNSVTVINTVTNIISTSNTISLYPYSTNNFIKAGNCDGTPVKFTITVYPPKPTITATGVLLPLHTTYGTPSLTDSFTASGINISAGILVTPPTGFEVSADGRTFSKSITIGVGNIVYLRLTATTPAGIYTGNIVLSTPGAIDINIPVAISTVIAASLTITANDKTKSYGSPNPVFTVAYAGFVNNDGPAQLIAQPVTTTTAISTSAIGQYPITATGAISPNYIFTYMPGVLNIISALSTVSIPNTFTPNGDGINDNWVINGLDSYPQSLTQVFNRYGGLVFQSQGYPKAWDGRFKGKDLSYGTYYYKIDLKNGTILSGWISILK